MVNVIIRVTVKKATEAKAEKILIKKAIIITKIKTEIIIIITVFIITTEVFFKKKKLRRRLISSSRLTRLTATIIYLFLKLRRLKRP